MNILSHLKLRTKLTLLLGLSTVAVIAQSLENRVVAHALTREQALAMLRDDVHALRFNNGDGYVFAQTLDNIFVLHGVNSAMEGKPSQVVNENGRPLTDLISDALRNSDDGSVTYLFAKPGQTERLPKVTYVARFAPWDLVFGAGDYVDDIDAAFHTTLLRLSLIGGATLIVTLVAGWVVNRDITVSLGSLKTAMDQLAKGNLTTAVPGVDRRDEIGDMAATVLVFKDSMTETERLQAGQEAVKLKAAAEQKAALRQMAGEFESKVGHLVGMLSSSSTELEATAQSMTGAADQSNQQATAVASAAEEASTGLQTVASAAEELTASIGEISRQVSQSSKITGKAVDDAKRTDAIVHALAQGAEKIGAVVGLITNIASQTNLLHQKFRRPLWDNSLAVNRGQFTQKIPIYSAG
jgi:methyl-accepting chemotaxis protein